VRPTCCLATHPKTTAVFSLASSLKAYGEPNQQHFPSVNQTRSLAKVSQSTSAQKCLRSQIDINSRSIPARSQRSQMGMIPR